MYEITYLKWVMHSYTPLYQPTTITGKQNKILPSSMDGTFHHFFFQINNNFII